MREQGIAANATSRAARGQTKRAERDAAYRAKARRRSSYALRDELQSIARELSATGTIRDAKRGKLLETRRTLVAGWNALAERLEAQGEVALGGDVRYFAKHLPPVMTDRERLASELVRIAQAQRSTRTRQDEWTRDTTLERTR